VPSELNVLVVGSGPALVMLHGGAGGIDDLAELRALLAPGHRVISPDQRGHGRSPDLGEMSYAAMAGDTAVLLDELGVRGADLVGWSDGGVVGLLLARDRPDLVGRLVAVSANAALEADPPALTDGARDYLAALQPGDLPMPDGRDALAGTETVWPATAAKIVTMWRVGPDLPIADLGRITAPVLYIAADRDIVPSAHTLAMFEATPGAQLSIVENANHRLPQQRAAEVAAIIERFLAG
jgi:pimeloyl-ACP methyl ester carboxylesterase